MPNDRNVSSPVTLIGLGRSGTSLLQAAFEQHSEFQVCGETGGMVFSVWEGAKSTFMPFPQAYWEIFEVDEDAKCAYYVNEVIKAICPSDARYWFQKPAGLPIKHLNRRRILGERGKLSGFPIEWYWCVLLKLYSAGKFITVVRNPFDIMISRKDHSRWAFRDIWKDIVSVYEIYDCDHARLDHVINFEELIVDFKFSLQYLCLKIGIDFQPAMLEAIAINQAGISKRGPVMTHRDSWVAFDGFQVDQAALDLIASCWNKWGWDLQLPRGLKVISSRVSRE